MSPLRREIAATFGLAWPMVATNVAVNAMTTMDVMFLGRLSPEALAAGTLGFNLYMPLFLFCVGVMSAAAPMAAARLGENARDLAGVRAVGHQAYLSALALCVPFWALFWNAGPILKRLGEPPELADLAQSYMHGLQWALLPGLFYFAARSVFSALHRVRAVMIVGLIAVGCNGLFNYALVFGRLGAPALGVFGSGLATTLSQVLMFAMLTLYGALDSELAPHRLTIGLWRFDGPKFAYLWRLGAPIGAVIALEVGVFGFFAIAMGWIGAAEIEAHAIALNIAATAFMVPLGLGMAASVRVGRAYGARDAAAVSRAGWTAFGLALAFVSASALAMALAPRLLISAFIDPAAPRNAATLAAAIGFVRVAAVFQISDGAQAALSNMLRGLHDARTPLAMAIVGYWGIGAPVGLLLGFGTPLRGLGLWIGLAIGLTAVALMLFARWRAKARAGFFSAADTRRPA